MEVELKRLEDLSESIVNDFAYMRAREEEMRDTNGLFGFSIQIAVAFVNFEDSQFFFLNSEPEPFNCRH
jgi:hypothetical protein